LKKTLPPLFSTEGIPAKYKRGIKNKRYADHKKEVIAQRLPKPAVQQGGGSPLGTATGAIVPGYFMKNTFWVKIVGRSGE